MIFCGSQLDYAQFFEAPMPALTMSGRAGALEYKRTPKISIAVVEKPFQHLHSKDGAKAGVGKDLQHLI